MTVRVKVCGITREKALKVAVDAGADAVGFVINAPDSPRNLSLQAAKNLIAKVPPYVSTVAVTALPALDEIAAAAEVLRPHALQLHGISEPRGYAILRRMLAPGMRVIGAIPLPETPTGSMMEQMKLVSGLKSRCNAVIVDSNPIGHRGGTGQRSNWTQAAKVQKALGSTPMILAGGLNPSNVDEAVREVKPYAVDVSTGVESTPGIKDPEKIRLFVTNAKRQTRK